MELSQVLALRKSCRRYADRPVERELLEACLEAGRLSPSGCNSQRWRFVVVDQPQLRAQVADCLCDRELHVNTFAADIPVLVALVEEPNPALTPKQHKLLGGRWRDPDILWHIDLGIAAQQICLRATELELGSVIMGWLDESRLKALLHIPQALRVPLVVGLGYPRDSAPRTTLRRPLEEVVSWNGYTPRKG